MAENKQKLNQWTNTPQKKSAFIKYMLEFNGNLQKFRAKHPKLAKLLPSDLTKLKIPVPVVGLFSVAAFEMRSLGDLSGINKSIEYYKSYGLDIPNDKEAHFMELMNPNTELGHEVEELIKEHAEALMDQDRQRIRHVFAKLNNMFKPIFGNRPKGEIAKILSIKSKEMKLYGELNAAEASSIIQSTQIHGDIYKDNILTKEQLNFAGLFPKFKIDVQNGTMYISKPFMAENRTAFIVYTKTEEGIVARTYYLSGSHGMWKYLPNYTTSDGDINWFGKSMSEEAITAPFELQKKLSQIASQYKALDLGYNWDYYFAGTARKLEYSGEKPSEHSIFQEVSFNPEYMDGNLSTGKRREKVPPEQIRLYDQNNKPNFNQLLDSYSNRHPVYGEVKNEVYLSHDGKYQYVFCTDKEGRTWIGNIQYNHNKIGSTGVRSIWVDAGDLTTPAYDYDTEEAGYGNFSKINGNYVDMYDNYVSKIPLIREYKAFKENKVERRENYRITPSFSTRENEKIHAHLSKNEHYTVNLAGRRETEIKLGSNTKLYIFPHPKYGYVVDNKFGDFINLPDKQYTTLGRSFAGQNKIFQYPVTVSNEHLVIYRDGDTFTFIDKSMNGTTIKTNN
jgi:hypothetical protein